MCHTFPSGPHFSKCVLSFEAAHELIVSKWHEIFLFLVAKGNLIVLCFKKSKFNYRLRIVASSSSDMFLRRRDFKFETVLMFTKVSVGNDCFVFVATITRYFYI